MSLNKPRHTQKRPNQAPVKITKLSRKLPVIKIKKKIRPNKTSANEVLNDLCSTIYAQRFMLNDLCSTIYAQRFSIPHIIWQKSSIYII